jgi:hypothetical protein
MDDRKRRLAQNEALFREVNDRVTDAHAEWSALAGRDDVFEIVCECAHEQCAETIRVTLAEYETVRAVGARFLIRPGHAIDDVEQVVERHDDYDVVEKTGESKQYVERLDPRSRPRP